MTKFLLALVFAFHASVFAAAVAPQDFNWKSVFIAGDDSIPNFDNGRVTLSEMFNDLGATYDEQVHLTSTRSLASNGVLLATAENLVAAFKSLQVGNSDACLVHMTSHGQQGQGFYLSQAGILAPDQFNKLLTAVCGDQPTIVMISACFSGQFVPALAAENRIIMTAASEDRPSFGCSADFEYTFWDQCLIQNIPGSSTWDQFASNVQMCIEDRESQLGFPSSNPQSYIGELMTDLPLKFR